MTPVTSCTYDRTAVEDAPDADEGEVHTREVPEDDVPEEYLDTDERSSNR